MSDDTPENTKGEEEKRENSSALTNVILGGVVATLLASIFNLVIAIKGIQIQKEIENHRVFLSMVEKKFLKLDEAKKTLFESADWVPAAQELKSGERDEFGKYIGKIFSIYQKQSKFLKDHDYLFDEKDLRALAKVGEPIDALGVLIGNDIVNHGGPAKPESPDKERIAKEMIGAVGAATKYSEDLEELIDQEIKKAIEVLFNK